MSMPGTLPFSNKSTLHSNSTIGRSSTYNNSTCNTSSNINNSEGEQSPPGHISNMSSAHDFAVFANVNIQGGSALSPFSSSQITLNTTASSVMDQSDTISLNSTMLPPELPKRSNSITSLPNNINCTDAKPILSPRTSDNLTHALRSQPIISPKLLDAVNEERSPPQTATLMNNSNNSEPPLISPRTNKPNSYQSPQSHATNTGDISATMNFNRSPFQNTSHRTSTSHGRSGSFYDEGASTSTAAKYPQSPKNQNIINDVNEFGPLPISPHVNVPNAHHFPHFNNPPPLPPRKREKQEAEAAIRAAQIQQAPDAPELPPRDISPPPIPPRLSLTHIAIRKSSNTSGIYNEDILREHSLKQPNTSTIMMRRNSALREGTTNDTNTSGSTSKPTSQHISTESLDKSQPNPALTRNSK